MQLRTNFALQMLAACSLILSGIADAARAADEPAAAEKVSYFRQVLPIFRTKNCIGCHQPAKRGGEYVMTSFADLLKGGESGDAAIVAGSPDKSYLMGQITPVDGKAEMPKDGPPLTQPEIDTITKWIAQGAVDDTPASNLPTYDADHPPLYQAAPVIRAIEFSPTEDIIAVGGYHEVLLHKADGTGLVGRLVGQSERIESITFSPDGKMLAATGGSPGRFGEVQIWDVATRTLKLSHTAGYDTLYGGSWSPDGKMVSFGCPDNTIRAIDPATGKEVLFNGAHSDWVLDTIFSTKSDHVISVSRDMSMKLIEVPTQRFIDNITSITPGALKGGLMAIDRHPTKDELLCGGSDGRPQVFKMIRTEARKIGDNANLLREFPALPGRVFGVAYSPDGNLIAACSSSDGRGEVRVYAAADGAEKWKLAVPEGGQYSVDFSRDGNTLAVAGFDGDIRLLKVADGSLMTKFTPVEVMPSTVAASK
ncbi:Planctomycete cytochrome C [Pirellula staleyi DSM 6068]|uniref:Planctomycete cytochrome C n=1 Tax=Pirellula staleyi (strain ATCC 27377 / DSM 6068 / ICPB 4128) TaxID=530564 RepID=D2R3U9_PIRSD|nr:c-type cytochrome domain-containing protein [Pirellula staleyi]ADB17053.1 Planctomycete cytochrome C [Pirellula staleyi DSM 6068]